MTKHEGAAQGKDRDSNSAGEVCTDIGLVFSPQPFPSPKRKNSIVQSRKKRRLLQTMRRMTAVPLFFTVEVFNTSFYTSMALNLQRCRT